MEKYEINKFIEEYNKKLNNLKLALNIDTKVNKVKELDEIINNADFWNNPNEAKKILDEANGLKEDIDLYNEANKGFNDIKELIELAEIDEDANLLLDDEINDYIKKYIKYEQKALLNDKYDINNCILELHPGAGGTESMDWALMLFRMYQRFANNMGFKFQILNYLPGDEAGIKSATILIKGKYAYGLLKAERGVHRLVRISPFDSNKRRHTSFCSVDIAPEIDAKDDYVIKDEDIRIDVFHSSGAGGQSVNTTDSAVRITHFPTGIVVTCQNERSQLQNKEMCFNILKSKLIELELQKQEEELKKLKGETLNINFGSQIRSYVFCPYTLVKDHRTNYENANVEAVMDGDILEFIYSYLRYIRSE